MRAAFTETIVELAERDPRILLLTGDLGYCALEPFAEKFPDRFFNCGVAEQNMVGVATGLAEAGYIPFVYSIATFASLRTYEFIRNGPILHHLPVRIVGVGGGFEYGTAGPTHYGLEDAGVMRLQPGLTVISPADHQQTRTAMLATWHLPGPIYYRLGKDDKTVVPGLDGSFELGRAQFVRYGQDMVIIAMGGIAAEAAAAAADLAARGIECTVVVVAGLNPAPLDDLAKVLSGFSIALTVEAHYTVGGIGSLVSEIVAEQGLGCQVIRCGVWTAADGTSGSQAYMQRLHGISREALVETIFHELETRQAVKE
ncbi:MAG TPA: transketolase C-terminal domain-containing protein [Blastocatellia bacterium]|nr:transketolase C-terminal domain-containing protein [Blastocatellia bacterium]HMX25748.1 transketolase C-terminal domain-containing protein [Blastocatellia bacterium]HMZ18674.1 transketolase C-terminal domain-containing protein [Blastocatellia bacterium]HNG28996.1 transketolase C-terminal domain-containing protein [Blastocatellia bacterium]